MPSISQQIAAVKMRKSPEQIAREASEARRRQQAFRVKVEDQRAPGSLMHPSFLRQLEARRIAVESGSTARRPDPQARIALLRAEGKLPPVAGEDGERDRPEYAPTYSPRDALQRLLGAAPAPQERVAYEPTPEEILGEDALPKPHAVPSPDASDPDCPPPDEVLKGSAEAAPAPAAAPAESPYLPGDLTPEELAEIDRLNPRAAAAPAGQPVARPGRPVHTGKQRQRGR